MAKFDVDSTLKLFIAKAGVTSFDVKVDLYSDAKEHWIAGGAAMGFDFPIRTIGGDPIGGGLFAGDLYFMRFGWRLRAQEAHHQLKITGNLFHDDAIDIFVPTLGAFTVTILMERSNLVLVTKQLADVIDGTVTGAEILKRLNAYARGRVNKAGDYYSYSEEDDVTVSFKNLIGPFSRTPV